MKPREKEAKPKRAAVLLTRPAVNEKLRREGFAHTMQLRRVAKDGGPDGELIAEFLGPVSARQWASEHGYNILSENGR